VKAKQKFLESKIDELWKQLQKMVKEGELDKLKNHYRTIKKDSDEYHTRFTMMSEKNKYNYGFDLTFFINEKRKK